MIARDTVLTLRDLRGERAPQVRTIPWGTRMPEWSILYAQALIELAGVAMDWRKDDPYPVPEGHPAQRDEAVLHLVKDIAKAITDGERASFCQADCTVITSWEPAA